MSCYSSSVDHGEELIILETRNQVKLTNLIPVHPKISTRCAPGCGLCGGRVGTPVRTSRHWYIAGNGSWKLEGKLCANFQADSQFHLFLSLSPGSLEGMTELSARFEPCPTNSQATKFKDLPKHMSECVLSITLRGGGRDSVQLKAMQFEMGPTITGWSDLKLVNKSFLKIETFSKFFQLSPQGANRNSGTLDIFEFIEMDVHVRVGIRPEASMWKSSPCGLTPFYSVHESLKISTPYKRRYNGNKSETNRESESPPAKKLKFLDTITLKVKSSSYENEVQSFRVHKSVLFGQSEVFDKMLETNVQEQGMQEVIFSEDTPEAVEAFISFLYGIEDEDTTEDISVLLQVLPIAHRYQIAYMIDKIVAYIVALKNKTLDVPSFLEIFAAGECYDLFDLKFRTIQLLPKYKDVFCGADGMLQVQKFFGKNPSLFGSFVAKLMAGV